MKKRSFLLLLPLLFQVYAGNAQHTQRQLSTVISRQIDTLLMPDIEGIKQALEIKTDDSNKPVLLFLSGGPGSSMMPAASSFTSLLKTKFTLVQWDQRDAGKTLALNPSPTQPSVAQMKRDTYQVIRFLTKELNQEKIYLAGSSWGNVLGFYMVEKHPELLHGYFAVNPVISQLASEQELLEILRTHFKEDPLASKELASVTIPFEKDEDLFYLRKWLFYKEGKKYATSDEFKNGFLKWSATWSPVWNEVMAIDLPKTLKKVKCPIYFFVGKNDIQTSSTITQNYFQVIKAPRKSLFVFENSGHQIHKDEPEKLQKAILQTLEIKGSTITGGD
ncbi:alpha/beta hydrolase [Hymenobacter sp. J193]|uniref:alpha/beta fold hydrolase n=1 Tax=Hymenobacter sp. J193 TaxID=2898429 RepID=UPI002150FF7F|nr:alpha/beta hydrolase [Hymenobacter sp. J193]MCR5890936.1 alpha/beta hydrolase [Hymenobacter sp. J193]